MSIIKKIRRKISLYGRIEEIIRSYNSQTIEFLNRQRNEETIEKYRKIVLECTKLGISKEKYCDREIIVSLTSYGNRIFDVAIAIESIMQGTLLPNRIILWLSQQEFQGKSLPRTLLRQVERGLEIRFTEDIRSYKKLIPSLQTYPDSVIITIDDDLVYCYDFVEKLVNEYKADATCIHAYRVSKMSLCKNGGLRSYLEWETQHEEGDKSRFNFFTTGGGVLFPPNSLDMHVFDNSVFMSICKYADDVWLNAMAIKKGTLVRKTYSHNEEGDEFIPISIHQKDALCIENNNPLNCRNDIQIKAVFERYGIFQKLRESRNNTLQ